MKCIRVDLPSELQELRIEIFSDLHIGSKKCDYFLIKERIEKVKNDPHRYAILLGDHINNSTKTSVGDVYEEELSPMQQVQLAVDMFKPIKDKILAITSGNHERRSYKTDGMDLSWFLAKELGLEKRYDYCACLLFLRFGELSSRFRNKKVCYTIYLSHGDGQGGRTVGGKANGLQKRGQIVNSDIVVTGHTHAPLSFRDCCYEIDYGNSTVKTKEQVFVNASACLDYEEYAELFGMKPSSKKSPMIILSGKKKSIDVVM